MKKNEITAKESQAQLQMAKNMQKFLAETKGIPCKIINLNEGKKMKDPDDKDKEIDVPGVYVVKGLKGKKGSRSFNWNISFDQDDIDDKGLPRRHLIIEDEIDFEVTKNPHLNMILELYRKPAKVKEDQKAEVESK